MTIGMTVSKIAVSVPDAVVKRVRRAVARGRAPSVSAYVTAALEHQAQLDELEEMLEGMLELTGGPPTPAEKREADRVLGISNKSKQGAT